MSEYEEPEVNRSPDIREYDDEEFEAAVIREVLERCKERADCRCTLRHDLNDTEARVQLMGEVQQFLDRFTGQLREEAAGSMYSFTHPDAEQAD